MNCPGHMQVFKQGLRSYRELPLRIAEFGKVHRYEPSGALHGLMRVRAFTQDDAHIFCTHRADHGGVGGKVTELILSIYRDFGFTDVRIKFSDRPAKRVGSDEVWDTAEAALREAARGGRHRDHAEIRARGPFTARSSSSYCATPSAGTGSAARCRSISNLPGRLGASYVAEDSQKHTPVMLHRAMFGSLERFIGILIEHHAGKLPTWLAPVQAVVMGITNAQDQYCLEVAENLKNQGLRVETDLRYEKVGFKIREHTIKRVPYLLVAGDREVEATYPGRTHAQWQRSRQSGARRALRLALRRSREPRPSCFGGSLIATSKRVRRNEEISAPSVRVIAADGSQAGVMTRAEALQMASSQALDLVEVSPMAEPPVGQGDGFRQILVRTEQEGARGEAKAEADSGQGSEVSSRDGRGGLPGQTA